MVFETRQPGSRVRGGLEKMTTKGRKKIWNMTERGKVWLLWVNWSWNTSLQRWHTSRILNERKEPAMQRCGLRTVRTVSVKQHLEVGRSCKKASEVGAKWVSCSHRTGVWEVGSYYVVHERGMVFPNPYFQRLRTLQCESRLSVSRWKVIWEHFEHLFPTNR